MHATFYAIKNGNEKKATRKLNFQKSYKYLFRQACDIARPVLSQTIDVYAVIILCIYAYKNQLKHFTSAYSAQFVEPFISVLSRLSTERSTNRLHNIFAIEQETLSLHMKRRRKWNYSKKAKEKIFDRTLLGHQKIGFAECVLGWASDMSIDVHFTKTHYSQIISLFARVLCNSRAREKSTDKHVKMKHPGDGQENWRKN